MGVRGCVPGASALSFLSTYGLMSRLSRGNRTFVCAGARTCVGVCVSESVHVYLCVCLCVCLCVDPRVRGLHVQAVEGKADHNLRACVCACLRVFV